MLVVSSLRLFVELLRAAMTKFKEGNKSLDGASIADTFSSHCIYCSHLFITDLLEVGCSLQIVDKYTAIILTSIAGRVLPTTDRTFHFAVIVRLTNPKSSYVNPPRSPCLNCSINKILF